MHRLVRSRSFHILIACGLLVAFFLVTYWEAPKNSFHFDDRASITEHHSVRVNNLGLDELKEAWVDAFLPNRPLPSVTFAIDWWRGGGDPATFIRTNLFIHAVNGFLVLGLLLLLLAGRGEPNLQMFWAATIGASAWLLHPIQVQSVTYIVQRMNELSALFSLLSVIAYVIGRTRSNRPSFWIVLALGFYGLASLCKENAWLIPMLWIFAEYGICRGPSNVSRTRFDYLFISLPLLGALVLLGDVLASGPISDHFRAGYGIREFTLEERLLTQPRVIGFHLSQIAWPLPERFSLEHDFQVSRSLLSPPSTLVAWLAVGVWLIGGVFSLAKPRWQKVGFCLLWLGATLVVESTIVPLEMVFEHRMYLPSFGLAGLLSLLFLKVFKTPGVHRYVAGILAMVYLMTISLATNARIDDWRTPLKLYESSIDNAPGSQRLWGNLSSLYADQGDWDSAEKAARRALASDPTMSVARETLAVRAFESGNLDFAESELGELAASRPVRHTIFNHYGEVLFAKGRKQEAAKYFLYALQRAPWEPAYNWNAALATEQLGMCAQAHGYWLKYLELGTDQGELQEVRGHLDEVYNSNGGYCFGTISLPGE